MTAFLKKSLPYLLTSFLGIMLITTLLPHTCSAYIYWSNSGSSAIGRANLDGTGVNQSWITWADKVYGVAADANYVYWANNYANTIGRANLDGTGVNQSWITGASRVFGPSADANYVYWSNYEANTIGRANLDGTGVNQSWITGCNLPCLLAVGLPSSPPAPATPVPTLNEWGMIFLSIVLMGIGIGYIIIRRRESASV